VRISRAHDNDGQSVVIDGKAVDYVNEFNYLGWFIMSAKTFRVNAHRMRARFSVF